MHSTDRKLRPGYELLSDQDLVEVLELDRKIADLEARLKASYSEEQKRLAWDLGEAEDSRDYELRVARMDAMIEHLAEHFPGIGPALKLVAGHCAWGSDINMGCCDLGDHGVGL